MLQSVDQESLQYTTNLRLSCSQDLSNYIRAIMKVDIVDKAQFWHVTRGLPEHSRLSAVPRSSKRSRKSETIRRGGCNSRPTSTCDIALLPPSILSLSQSYNYFRDTDVVAWSCAWCVSISSWAETLDGHFIYIFLYHKIDVFFLNGIHQSIWLGAIKAQLGNACLFGNLCAIFLCRACNIANLAHP